MFAAITLLAIVVRPASAPAAPPPPRWGSFVHVATSELDSASVRAAIAERFDVIVLRGRLTRPLLADLHNRRPGIVLLAYEKAAGLNASEVKTLSVSHPEWIARDVNGDTIHPVSAAGTTLADLTSGSYRRWRASRIADEVRLGADGAFVDTVGAYFPPDFYTGRPVVDERAVTDGQWRHGSADLLRRIKAVAGGVVVANGFGLGSGAAYFKRSAAADVLIAAADGIQIEGFTRWGEAPLAPARRARQWQQDLEFLNLLGERGKVAMAYTKVKQAGVSEDVLQQLRDYGLASFLVAFVPGSAYFGFDSPSSSSPPTEPVWARELGAPLSAASPREASGWSRVFEGGRLVLTHGQPPRVQP